MTGVVILIIVLVIGLIFLFSSVKVAREYERGVVFRLGRLIGIKGPGLFILIPFIDKAVKVDLRTVTLNVPPQEVITRDNVTVKVNAVAYFRVVDASKAIVQVENYLVATSQIAQTTLRSVLGQVDLDQLLSERDQINERLQTIIDSPARPRPSASAARRSSPPTASTRRRRSSARPPRSSAPSPARSSSGTCRP
jgi:regulator of protease activity HflC (stomatin/prohibitin superfamily)